MFQPAETLTQNLSSLIFCLGLSCVQSCIKVMYIEVLVQDYLFGFFAVCPRLRVHCFICIDIGSVATSLFFFISVALLFFLQAPAVDVVAVGLVSGHIIIHNIKFDETLMKFQQDWGRITAISFRTGKL